MRIDLDWVNRIGIILNFFAGFMLAPDIIGKDRILNFEKKLENILNTIIRHIKVFLKRYKKYIHKNRNRIIKYILIIIATSILLISMGEHVLIVSKCKCFLPSNTLTLINTVKIFNWIIILLFPIIPIIILFFRIYLIEFILKFLMKNFILNLKMLQFYIFRFENLKEKLNVKFFILLLWYSYIRIISTVLERYIKIFIRIVFLFILVEFISFICLTYLNYYPHILNNLLTISNLKNVFIYILKYTLSYFCTIFILKNFLNKFPILILNFLIYFINTIVFITNKLEKFIKKNDTILSILSSWGVIFYIIGNLLQLISTFKISA